MLHKTQFITNLKGHFQTQTCICVYIHMFIHMCKMYVSKTVPQCWVACLPVLWQSLLVQVIQFPPIFATGTVLSNRTISSSVPSHQHPQYVPPPQVLTGCPGYRQELKVMALPNLCSGYVILLMLLPDSALRTYLPSSF